MQRMLCAGGISGRLRLTIGHIAPADRLATAAVRAAPLAAFRVAAEN